MRIAIVDASGAPEVTYDSLRPIAEAIQAQLYGHVAPFWQSDGCAVRVVPSLADLQHGESPLVVFDDPDQAGVLGYHALAPNGLPYGKAFWSVISSMGGTLSNGANSLSVTLSHEAIEMFVDPYASFWADMPDGVTEEAQEACDRVEGDCYRIGEVSVSDFLGPRAFRCSGKDGPFDWMGVLNDAWEIRPSGYAIRRKGGPAGTVESTFGAAYPEAKKAIKLAHGRGMQARGGLAERVTKP